MRPVVDGVITSDGYLFEKKYIYKYIKENHMNPCTGKKLMLKDLFPVHFYKNAEGEIHCPVTYKPFTKYSKIAVIRTSGNVYLYDCIKDLNIAQKNWNDLIVIVCDDLMDCIIFLYFNFIIIMKVSLVYFVILTIFDNNHHDHHNVILLLFYFESIDKLFYIQLL